MDELEQAVRMLELERLRLPTDLQKRRTLTAQQRTDQRLGRQRLKEVTAEVFGSKNR